MVLARQAENHQKMMSNAFEEGPYKTMNNHIHTYVANCVVVASSYDV